MDRESMMQRLRELEALLSNKEIHTEPEAEEEPAEEVKHRTSLISECKQPGIFHSNLIPWYTSGFD